eukprot:9471600-Pyramimonas_sp.AAC.1
MVKAATASGFGSIMQCLASKAWGAQVPNMRLYCRAPIFQSAYYNFYERVYVVSRPRACHASPVVQGRRYAGFVP